MLCENCGKSEANIKYTQIINNEKKEMMLCEHCVEKLGIDQQVNFNFNMPIDLQSFLGEFLNEDETMFSNFAKPKEQICNICGMTYSDFVNIGKLGCAGCYDAFSERLNYVIKNLHGLSKHTGRKKILNKQDQKDHILNKVSKLDQQKEKLISQASNKEENTKINGVGELKYNLKLAIKEERYEDAAKIRDEIKKIEQQKNEK